MLKDELNIKKIINDLEKINYKDPDHFEKLRKELIDITIKSYPKKFQKRARGIQFQLDYELNKYKDPVNRMNRMVELFWDKFHEFNDMMNDPAKFTFEREKNKKKGKVLPLH